MNLVEVDVVAEELYEQTSQLIRGSARGFATRRLHSDFLFVRLPGDSGLTPFLDVFEVDDKKVRDRDDRLQRLFLEMPADARDTARRVLDEGARFNIGGVYRNINQPMLALGFL